MDTDGEGRTFNLIQREMGRGFHVRWPGPQGPGGQGGSWSRGLEEGEGEEGREGEGEEGGRGRGRRAGVSLESSGGSSAHPRAFPVPGSPGGAFPGRPAQPSSQDCLSSTSEPNWDPLWGWWRLWWRMLKSR